MKYLNKFLLIIVIGFAFTFLSSSKTYSQLIRVAHEVGKLHTARPDNFGNFSQQFYYPGGSYKSLAAMADRMFIVPESLIGIEGGTPIVNTFSQGGPSITEVFMLYRKHPLPSIKVDGIELAPPFLGEIDPDMDPDSYWTMKKKIWGNLAGYLSMDSRAYVNENHDDYVIYETSYEMGLDLVDGDGVDDMPEQTINVMLAHYFNHSMNVRGLAAYGLEGANKGRRNQNWRHAEYFPVTLATGAPRDNLVISLSYGADIVSIDKPGGWSAQGSGGTIDESGAPWGPETGELTIDNCELIAPFYAGTATLHSDKSVNDQSDDINMPIATGKIKPWGFLNNYKAQGIFNWMTTSWEIREDEMGYQDPYGFKALFVFNGQNWGPYAMKNGESFKTVYVSAYGSVSNDLAREKGLEFMKWYRDGEGTFDTDAKNAFIAQSQDSLVLNINRAYWNYNNKHYDIPDPLGAPDIAVKPFSGKIQVSYGYPNSDMFDDPDTGVDDFKEWRIYRKRGNKLVNHDSDNGYLKYELVHTASKDETEWLDLGVILGTSYYYCVTAVDDGSQNSGGLFPGQSLESSFYANRTIKDVLPVPPGLDVSDEVLIVPNPYSLSTGINNAMNYTGHQNDLHFVNLPAYCTLKIYTATGDLIKTIEHTTGSGDEIWKDMRTESNQAPVSGVYILVVDDAKDLNNNRLPNKFFKFVIVR